MGNLYLLAASTSKSSSSPLTLLLPFILIIAVFYFLLMRPQRNRQRRIQETQSSIGPGQRIRTTAGMYGTVVAVEDDDLILEIAPDVEIRVLRRAVMDVLPGNVYEDGTEEAEDSAEDEGAEDEGAEEPESSDGLLDAPPHADGSGADGSGPADAAEGHDDEAEPGADRQAEGTRAREK
jgi:preprotein translocase subunit YajC